MSEPVHHHLGEGPSPAKETGSRAGATQAGKEQAAGWAAGGYGVKALRLASEVERNWFSRRLPAEVERVDTAADELHPPGSLLLVA